METDVKQAIALARQRQAHFANQHRTEREFEEGDWVFLSTTNLRVRTLTKKLTPRYVGPLRISQKISRTAYRLDIPSSWKARRLHDVFYVGLLKEHKGPMPQENVQLPPLANEEEEFEVEYIREHRKTVGGYKFLVKWKGYPEEENTWQSRKDLANAPRIVARYCQDQEISQEVEAE